MKDLKVSTILEQAKALDACSDAVQWAEEHPDATLEDLKKADIGWYIWGMAHGLYLIKKDINLKDKDGNTALLLATSYGRDVCDISDKALRGSRERKGENE